jgi:hypothetical protein
MTEDDQIEQQNEEKVYIRDAAAQLNRRMATLRKWEQLGLLPPELHPHRGERGWRYWTPDQVEGLKTWIKETDRRPGKGLPHYDPTEADLDKAIAMMRKPRKQPGERGYGLRF